MVVGGLVVPSLVHNNVEDWSWDGITDWICLMIGSPLALDVRDEFGALRSWSAASGCYCCSGFTFSVKISVVVVALAVSCKPVSRAFTSFR